MTVTTSTSLTTVPAGWTPRARADRLARLAAICFDPARAAELRSAADAIKAEIGEPRACGECGLELQGADPGARPNGIQICTVCEFRGRDRRERQARDVA